jgi:hypothetical protein
MKLLNSKSAYKSVQIVVQGAKSKVSKTEFWRSVHNAYGFGHEERRHFVLSATDRVNLAKQTFKQTGYDPRKDEYIDMVNMSRTESSKKGFDEKAFSTNPREPFVEVRYYNGHLDNGYRGIYVDQAISLSADLILSIENFDTFVWIDEHYLRDVIINQSAIKSVLLVFRGDSKASPKAVKKLRNSYQGKWWHFGDFDPKGVEIAVADMKSDVVIMPDLQSLQAQLKLQPNISDSDIFHKQTASHAYIEKLAQTTPALTDLLDAMLLYKLAVCQEPLTSREVNLISVSTFNE